MTYRSTLLPERFWERVEIGEDGYHSQTGENLGPCWIWLGGQAGKGYGRWIIKKRSNDGPRVVASVHRSAYQALVGDIPENLEIDHLCRIRNCCNPSHLEAVTSLVNKRRGLSAVIVGRQSKQRNRLRRELVTHCPKGHAYAIHGVVSNIRYPESRRCGLCRIEYNRAYWATHRNK